MDNAPPPHARGYYYISRFGPNLPTRCASFESTTSSSSSLAAVAYLMVSVKTLARKGIGGRLGQGT